MEEKHYAPEESEFYQGFEYEEYYGKESGWKKETFVLESWSPDSTHLCYLIESGTIRVKYLDDEDIEECGWNYIEAIESGIHSYTKNGWGLIVWYHKEKIVVEIENDLGNIVFGGTIKNKSELLKIMEMIGCETK